MTLYKYLGHDLVRVLRDREIRFTQAAALNDPFELRPYFERFVADSDLRRHFSAHPIDITPNLVRVYQQLSPEQKANLSPESFLKKISEVVGRPEFRQQLNESFELILVMLAEITPQLRGSLIEHLRTTFGILSLSEVADHALMWSFYASNHKGFIVGFNESHPFFDQRRGLNDDYMHLRPVSYRPPTSVSVLTELHAGNVFYCKPPEWSYEREWRMVMPVQLTTRTTDSPNGPLHLVSFPSDAVDCVIIGAQALPTLELELRGVLAHPEFKHVHLRRVRIDGPTGLLVVEPA